MLMGMFVHSLRFILLVKKKKNLDTSLIPHNNLYVDLVALMTFACR